MHPLVDEMQAALQKAGFDQTEDRPKLHIDGRRMDPRSIDLPLKGTAAHLASTNDKTFPPIAERLDVARLTITEMRGVDLSALTCCNRLTHLNITWATKLKNISLLGTCRNLQFLEITDAPKITDLSAIGHLKNLRVLIYRGGIWNANRADTLDPLAELDCLEVLCLQNLRVSLGGLRPLAALTGLKDLFLSNQFDTADYAFLAAHLTGTACDQFSPYETLKSEIGGCNVKVTGKRKPFLDTRKPKDQARLEKYVRAFNALKDGFKSEN